MASKMILQGGWADQRALRVHWGVLTMYLSCIRGQGFVGGSQDVLGVHWRPSGVDRRPDLGFWGTFAYSTMRREGKVGPGEVC